MRLTASAERLKEDIPRLLDNSSKFGKRKEAKNCPWTYPKLLLPVGGHETLLRFLGFGSLLEAGADLRPLPLGLRLFPLLFLHFSCETPLKHLICESLAAGAS